MRILLAGQKSNEDELFREIALYVAEGFEVVANSFRLKQLQSRQIDPDRNGSVSIVCFDPSDANCIAEIFLRFAGFEVMVCPPSVTGFNFHLLEMALDDVRLTTKLRVIGCPNDSLSHLDDIISSERSSKEITFIRTPFIHGRAVAEYTLLQLGRRVRRLEYFERKTGHIRGAFPHESAASSTRTLLGKTIGVVGGSGKDGHGVIMLAVAIGMRVICTGARSPENDRKIRTAGGIIVSFKTLLEESDYISINCRKCSETIDMFGTEEIAMMKNGVIIVNPAGAEIINKNALFTEYSKTKAKRRIKYTILDMPYGGGRDNQAFSSDPDNVKLQNLGVIFTPRMAGYTLDSINEGVTGLASEVCRFIRQNSH